MNNDSLPTSKDMQQFFEALYDVFPLILSANLTQNTFRLFKHDNFLADELPTTGCYDEFISINVKNIHPDYREDFLRLFSRESLLKTYEEGTTDVYAELYQKGRGSDYQWVSTHVIRTTNQNGDVCQICIKRILNDVIRENMVEKHC